MDRGTFQKGYEIMDSIVNVFRVSLILFVFICGIMTGRVIEAKDNRIKLGIVDVIETQDKSLLVSWVEGIEIYFDSWQNGQVNLIVSNYGESKLQEVSIVNMMIDGIKVESYSCLDGISPGETRRCVISYSAEAIGNPETIPDQITGELYVRGSKSYVYQKICVEIS